MLHGDLGRSTTTGHSVVSDLLRFSRQRSSLPWWQSFGGVLLGVPLGIVAAVNRGRLIDHIARIVGLAGHSIPIFWLGLMALFVFYAKLQWVGASGRVDVFYEGMVEPITGFLLAGCRLARRMGGVPQRVRPHRPAGRHPGLLFRRLYQPHDRSFMLEQLSQEYVIAARAKGASRRQVDLETCLQEHPRPASHDRSAHLRRPARRGGAVETVFGWPGLGQYLTRGLQYNDMNVVMGAVLLIGVVFLTINVISDRLYRILDPRTR